MLKIMIFGENMVTPMGISCNVDIDITDYHEATFLAMAICETCKFVEAQIGTMSNKDFDKCIPPKDIDTTGDGIAFYSDN